MGPVQREKVLQMEVPSLRQRRGHLAQEVGLQEQPRFELQLMQHPGGSQDPR